MFERSLIATVASLIGILISASPAQAQWFSPPQPPSSPPPLLSWLDTQFGSVFGACGQNVPNIRRRLRKEQTPFVPEALAAFARTSGPDLRQQDGFDDQYAFSVVYTDDALMRPFAFGRLFDVDLGANSEAYVVPGNDMTTRGHNCVTLINAKMESRAAAPVIDVAAAMSASVRSEQSTTALVRSGTMESVYFNALSGAATGDAQERRLEALASVWRLQSSYYRNGGADPHPPLYILPRMKAIVFSTITGMDQNAMLDGTAHASGALGVVSGRVESTASLRSTVHDITQTYHLASWDRGRAYRLPAPSVVANEISQAISLELETAIPAPPLNLPETLVFRVDRLPQSICDPALWDPAATAHPEGGPGVAIRNLTRLTVAREGGECKVAVRLDPIVGHGADTRVIVTLTSSIGTGATRPSIVVSQHLAVADRQARLFAPNPPERVFGGGPIRAGEGFEATLRYQFEGTGSFTQPRITSVQPRLSCDGAEALALPSTTATQIRWDADLMTLEVTYNLPAAATAGKRFCSLDGRAIGTIVRGGNTQQVTSMLMPYRVTLPSPGT